MKAWRSVVPIAAATMVSACVVIPTAPMVAAIPGSTRTVDQFQADDAVCRGNAYAAVNGSGAVAANNAAANTIAATALGAAAGALIGAATGDAGAGAAIGAGTGLVFGGAANSNYAAASSYDLQRSYDFAYANCMYAHGHKVPAAWVEQSAPMQAVPRYPPRDYPPPASVAPALPPPAAAPPRY